MRYFLRSRLLTKVIPVLLLCSGLLALWKGTLIRLPLPDFIPTLARSVPVDAVLMTCSVTAIAVAAYPGTQLWERAAPRSVSAYSYLLAAGLGLFSGLSCGVVYLGDPSVWPVLMKLLGLVGIISVLYRCIGLYVSLIPSAFLIVSTIFARRPGEGIAPWAWLVNSDPQLHQVIGTLVLVGAVAFLADYWQRVLGRKR